MALNKKKRSKKVNINWIRITLAIAIVYFACTFINQQITLNRYNDEKIMYNSDIQVQTKLVEYYKNEKNNVTTDEFIENIARTKLGYVKPYEKVFVDINK